MLTGVLMGDASERLTVPARIMRWLPYDDWIQLHALIKEEARHYTVGSTSVAIYADRGSALHSFVSNVLREYGKR